MSAINQDIRTGPPGNDPNNPQNLFSYLIVGDKLKGSGLPDATSGTFNSSYLDTVTGIEYVKKGDGTWENFVDYSGFAPAVPVPDPLPINELQVDLIRGKNSDNVEITGSLNGDVNITLEATNALSINGGNCLISGSGNVISGSDIQGYDIRATNGTGKTISLKPATGEIEHVGAGQDLNITQSTGGQNINMNVGAAQLVISDNAGSTVLKNTTGPLHLAGQSGPGQIAVELDGPMYVNNKAISGMGICSANINNNLTLSTTGIGSVNLQSSANVNLTPSVLNANAGTNITFTSQQLSDYLALSTMTVRGVSTTSIISEGSNVEITSNVAAVNIISATGTNLIANSGNVVLNAPAGNILASSDIDMNSTNDIINWRKQPQTVTYSGANIGSNGVHYLDIGQGPIGPSDFGAIPIFDGSRIRSVQVALLYNGPWSFGGVGSASLEFFTVGESLPCIIANTTAFVSYVLPTTGDFYFFKANTIGSLIPNGTKIGCRLILTGTLTTSIQGDILVNTVIQ